jgi:hypothetical protein
MPTSRFPVNHRHRQEPVFLNNRAFEPFLSFRFTLYGVWDGYKDGMNLQGVSSQYSDPVFQSVSIGEYQNRQIRGLEWIARGGLSSVFLQTALKLSRIAQGRTGFADAITISPRINLTY